MSIWANHNKVAPHSREHLQIFNGICPAWLLIAMLVLVLVVGSNFQHMHFTETWPTDRAGFGSFGLGTR
jgi:hypothetical protein